MSRKVTIDGVEHVPACEHEPARAMDNMPYVICRGDRSGVFAGYLESKNGNEVSLRYARRLWYWIGASLSQIAEKGTPEPEKCKFPCAVDRVRVLDTIEILDCTETGKRSIESVKEWRR